MLKVNEAKLLCRFEELQALIDNNYANAKADAEQVATSRGWDSSKLLEFVLANDEKYNIENYQTELDLLSKYIIDVEPVEVDPNLTM